MFLPTSVSPTEIMGQPGSCRVLRDTVTDGPAVVEILTLRF